MTTTTRLRNGTLYDGAGSPPVTGDILIRGDRIAAVGDLRGETASQTIDLDGLAVAPGFINMLSWADRIPDRRRPQHERYQAGRHARSHGRRHIDGSPQRRDETQLAIPSSPPPISHYDIEWTTLGEYLEFLERKGVATNVASFVGSATLRDARRRLR